MATKKYCYSRNEEHYHGEFNTRQEAIDEASYGRDNDEVFYIAEQEDPLNLVSFAFGELIAESLYERMGDAVNHDCCEDWLDGSQGQKVADELNKQLAPIIEKVIREFAKPIFWGVKNVEEMSLYSIAQKGALE